MVRERLSEGPPAPADLWDEEPRREIFEPDRRRGLGWLAGILAGAGLLGFLVAGAFLPSRDVEELTAGEGPLAEAAPRPHLVEVPITPATATPDPTPAPTAAPTSAPAPAAPAPEPTVAPNPEGLVVSAESTCEGGTLRVTFEVSSPRALRWFTVYVDGESVKGGPISGTSHSGSYEQSGVAAGPHEVEVVAEDEAGRTADRHQATCA